jgi:hypothetical protein
MRDESGLLGNFRGHLSPEMHPAHGPIGPGTSQIVSSLQGKEFLYA